MQVINIYSMASWIELHPPGKIVCVFANDGRHVGDYYTKDLSHLFNPQGYWVGAAKPMLSKIYVLYNVASDELILWNKKLIGYITKKELDTLLNTANSIKAIEDCQVDSVQVFWETLIGIPANAPEPVDPIDWPKIKTKFNSYDPLSEMLKELQKSSPPKNYYAPVYAWTLGKNGLSHTAKIDDEKVPF